MHLATAVAHALDYAHRQGVTRRDLKPENILLQEGQPLVADFGITLAVSKAGGALTYVMLTGEPPHVLARLRLRQPSASHSV